MGLTSSTARWFGIYLLATLAGCAGRSDIPSQFPADVNNWTGRLDHVQFVNDFSITDYQQVRVEMETSGVTLPDADDNTYKPVVAVLHTAADTFIAGIRDTLPRPPVSADYVGSGKTLIVHAVVTEMNPGSAALRVWVNAGAGEVVTTIKGDVTDASDGRVLLRFNNTIKDAATLSLGFEGYEELLNGTVRRTGQGVGRLLADFTAR